MVSCFWWRQFVLMPVSKSEHSKNVKALVGTKVVLTRGQKMLVGSFSANIVYCLWITVSMSKLRNPSGQCGCRAGVRGDTDSGDWRGQHCTTLHTPQRKTTQQKQSTQPRPELLLSDCSQHIILLLSSYQDL